MSDLALELKKLGLHMPPKISWQFDNCGENKVYRIFFNKNTFLDSINKFLLLTFRTKPCLHMQVHWLNLVTSKLLISTS